MVYLPISKAHAYAIDTTNKNTFWRDSINKEILTIVIAFEVLPTGERAPLGWNKVTGHLVFDMKMDFTRKDR